MSINEVAEAAGFSRTAVSRMLRRSGGTRARTRQEVARVTNDIDPLVPLLSRTPPDASPQRTIS